MIPREEGEGLLAYFDRLTLMADERASLQVRFEAISEELATAAMAEDQLAHYSALIEADLSKNSINGIEISKPVLNSASETTSPLMQPANSEINRDANSAQNDHAALTGDHVAQAGTPSETQENTPVISLDKPANSGTNSETEEEFVSDSERAHTWVLSQKGEFAAADVSFELDIAEKSAAKYLAQLMAQAVIGRISGTGMSRIPSRYRLAGALATSAPSGDLGPLWRPRPRGRRTHSPRPLTSAGRPAAAARAPREERGHESEAGLRPAQLGQLKGRPRHRCAVGRRAARPAWPYARRHSRRIARSR
jgi:hypothetical protein